MKDKLLRYWPLTVFWLASSAIILKYHSPLTTFAFFALLLFLTGGALFTVTLLRALPGRLLWRFYGGLAVCWALDLCFVLMAGRDAGILVLGGLPFACLLAPATVMSAAFAATSRDAWWRTVLAAICFMASCLPILILGTFLLVA